MRRGVHAILYAFFDEREGLDRRAMRAQAEACVAAGFAGIAALGLATEAAKLSADERLRVMDWLAEDLAGRLPMGITISGASVAEQVAQLRHAEAAGAGWLILQPPAVGRYEAAEYLDFFGRVMAETDLPVAIQNAPQYLGRGLAAEDIERLRQRHANFRFIKAESTAEDCARLIALTGGTLKVFNGRGGQEMLACLKAGCDGFLLAPDIADRGARVMAAFDAGDRAGAEAMEAAMAPAIGHVMASIEHLVCYGKRLFAARAGLTVHDRAPALRPDAAGLAETARLAAMLGPFGG